jgi:DUF438 domain-containing protein
MLRMMINTMDVKILENEIMKEAKVEEKVFKHALKDLSVTEKAQAETHKVHSLQVLVQYYLLSIGSYQSK